jgi:hypothetical protein
MKTILTTLTLATFIGLFMFAASGQVQAASDAPADTQGNATAQQSGVEAGDLQDDGEVDNSSGPFGGGGCPFNEEEIGEPLLG